MLPFRRGRAHSSTVLTRIRVLTAAFLTCVALLLGGGPAIAGPVSDMHVQTDEEEAAEVRTLLVLVGVLTVLTVGVGALAARRR